MAWDCIVVGIGGIGSAALYWLTKTEPTWKILGLEQFELGHVRGGSQDFSRAIRTVYDSPQMTSFAKQAYEPWEILERESGERVLYKCGNLCWSIDESGCFPDILSLSSNMEATQSPYQILDGTDIQKRWPQLKTAGLCVKGIFDPNGGVLDPIVANSAHRRLALDKGAQILERTKVLSISRKSDEMLELTTSLENYRTRKLIITAGAWLNQLLSSFNLHIPLRVTEENVSYFATPNPELFQKERFPTLFFSNKGYYAVPIHGHPGFKIGIDAGGAETSAEARSWTPDPRKEAIVGAFLRKYLPQAFGPILETKTCLYTMTSDRTFILDSLKNHDLNQILICCGAGHGFKFAGLFGKILAELAVKGGTHYDISQFTLSRSAIANPDFVPTFKYGAKL